MKTFSINDIPEFSKKERIVVVGVIGKSAFRYPNKATPLVSTAECKENGIECHWDERRGVLYLHVVSYLDTQRLAELAANLSEHSKSTEKDADAAHWLVAAGELSMEACRAMALLFHLCHIVVLSSPTPVFDLGCLQLFKACDAFRTELATATTEALSSLNLGGTWESHGRSCCPRLVFHFRRAPSALRRNLAALKRHEHAVEDQLYYVLRKARIITNVCAKSLFAIPKNEEFVYMSATDDAYNARDVSSLIRGLVKLCSAPSSTQNTGLEERPTFQQFLQGHIDLALGEGFDDNVGKYAMTTSFFELPSAVSWRQAAGVLTPLYLEESEELSAAAAALHNALATDVRFSQARCAKVLPIAQASYTEGLPSHYSSQHHAHKVSVALGVLDTMARGPLAGGARERLRAACAAVWSTRRLCEAPSLTDRLCVLPQHDNTKEHSSGVRYVSACNCGRSKCSREDPYTVRSANHAFYTQAGDACAACATLHAIQLPVFQPSTPTYRCMLALLLHAGRGRVRRVCHAARHPAARVPALHSHLQAGDACAACATLHAIQLPVFQPSTPTYRCMLALLLHAGSGRVRRVCHAARHPAARVPALHSHLQAGDACAACATLHAIQLPVFQPSTPTYRCMLALLLHAGSRRVRRVCHAALHPAARVPALHSHLQAGDACAACATLHAIQLPVFQPSTPTYRCMLALLLHAGSRRVRRVCHAARHPAARVPALHSHLQAGDACAACATLHAIQLPVFQPSTPTYRCMLALLLHAGGGRVRRVCHAARHPAARVPALHSHLQAADACAACATLHAIQLPVFQPSTPTYRCMLALLLHAGGGRVRRVCHAARHPAARVPALHSHLQAGDACAACATLHAIQLPVFQPSTPTYRCMLALLLHAGGGRVRRVCHAARHPAARVPALHSHLQAGDACAACATLHAIQLPVFQPSTPTYRCMLALLLHAGSGRVRRVCHAARHPAARVPALHSHLQAGDACAACATLHAIQLPVFQPSTPTYRCMLALLLHAGGGRVRRVCHAARHPAARVPALHSHLQAGDACAACATLHAIQLPVFQPSTPTYRCMLALLLHAGSGRVRRVCHAARHPAARVPALHSHLQAGDACAACATLHAIQLPVFQPSTPTYRAASVKGASSQEDKEVSECRGAGSGEADTAPSQEDAWSPDALSPGSPGTPGTPESSPKQERFLVPVRADSNPEKVMTRQPSTTEYLPGMLHLSSPPGLLPAFSSWSLVMVGPSSLYSHSMGLPEHLQPGFLPHTNYLLPWDCAVRMDVGAAMWRTASRGGGAGSRGGKGAQPHHNLTVKIFIGFEYECPRGHRLMMASPDTVVSGGAGNTISSGAGAKLAATDMPLCVPCLCRAHGSSSGAVATPSYLTRIHVVTPKAPVHVTLDPRAQPVPGGPTFVPQPPDSAPLKLSPSAYWVLRLPFVYADERGLLPRPRPHQGALIAPVFGLQD
ncbi:hypothetical protein O0L34_g16976 [Tuta absoluta]|nr:hypothetical protein O0L34_g16976 [Tuta absoluta]